MIFLSILLSAFVYLLLIMSGVVGKRTTGKPPGGLW